MWCTKSIGLVALLVSGLCNARELQREESNVRMDAEQDPFEKLMIDDANGPTSKLFGNCLAAARTLEAKLYSIEMPTLLSNATVSEYVRYVPDSYQLLVPADWQSITTNAVSSIFECATAAFEKEYPMFKYNGVNSCKVANRTYDLAYAPACETDQREAVFILSKAKSACPLPAVMHKLNATSGTFTCIFITTDLMTRREADAWCNSKKNVVVFTDSKIITYPEIVQVLNGLNVGKHDFFTKTLRSPDGTWTWEPRGTAVDPALIVGKSTSQDDILYMKGSAGFKLDIGQASSFKAGVVCVEKAVARIMQNASPQ